MNNYENLVPYTSKPKTISIDGVKYTIVFSSQCTDSEGTGDYRWVISYKPNNMGSLEVEKGDANGLTEAISAVESKLKELSAAARKARDDHAASVRRSMEVSRSLDKKISVLDALDEHESIISE